MSFVITSGGTAGHIYPALAVAAELKRLGKEVVFAGSIGGMEERMVARAGLPYQAFAAKGFNRRRPLTLVSSGLMLLRSARKARAWLKEIGAEAVAAFGGYVSVPVGRGAVRERIPLLIHEQNSLMGWANTHLSSHAEVIALTYEAARSALSPAAQKRVVITGNPVRPEFAKLANPKQARKLRSKFRQELGVSEAELLLLVFGGSQGARHINQALLRIAPELMQRPEVHVLQLTGQKEFESVTVALAQALPGKERERWQLVSYCEQMPAAFAAADIVLSRAGASSLAELAVAAKPALLIPYPYATADHQHKNAASLVEARAARMVLDSELESPRFSEALFALVDDPAKRRVMQEAAQELTQKDAAAHVTELLLGIAGSRRPTR